VEKARTIYEVNKWSQTAVPMAWARLAVADSVHVMAGRNRLSVTSFGSGQSHPDGWGGPRCASAPDPVDGGTHFGLRGMRDGPRPSDDHRMLLLRARLQNEHCASNKSSGAANLVLRFFRQVGSKRAPEIRLRGPLAIRRNRANAFIPTIGNLCCIAAQTSFSTWPREKIVSNWRRR